MLTVAILNFNGMDTLRESIQSVLDQEIYPWDKFRFIVIDNDSTDDSKKIALDMGVEVIESDNKYKFITGLNVALGLCQDWLFFMQNDVILKPECLRQIYFTSNLEHSFVQPVIYQTEGQIDNSGMDYKWPGYGERKHTKWWENYEYCMRPTFVTTIAFLISKKLIDKVGLFDERFYPAYYEDLDYNLRLKNLALIEQGHIRLNAEVIHKGNHTFSQTYKKKEISKICLINRNKLIKKHYKGFDKFLRLTMSTCFYVMKKTINIIADWRVPKNDIK